MVALLISSGAHCGVLRTSSTDRRLLSPSWATVQPRTLRIRGFGGVAYPGSRNLRPELSVPAAVAAPTVNAESTSVQDASSAVPYQHLTVGVPRESFEGEKRVALTPAGAATLLKEGFAAVLVERGAGAAAEFSDEAYQAVGARVVDTGSALGADVVLKIRPPSLAEARALAPGARLISHIQPARNRELLQELAAKGATVVAMDCIPRQLSRAQTFDSLSSQANIAGYRAVVEAAHHFGRFFTGQITAAGRMPPAKVLVIGGGVAGLAAVGAARSLGAIVRVFDTRTAVKEQAKSMGAEFLTVDIQEEGDGGAGYSKEMSPAFIAAEMALFAAQAKEVDVIITTALIPNKPAPKLVLAEHVASMKPGSVVVDLSSEAGGNCELTQPGKVVRSDNGVTIVGYTDLPSRLPTQSSTLYSNNISKYLLSMGPFTRKVKAEFAIDYKDEAVRGALVMDRGVLTWPPPPPPPPSPAALAAQASSAAAAAASAATASAAAALPKDKWQEQASSATSATLATLAALVAGVVAPSTAFVSMLTKFCLASICGYQTVLGVTAALHSPLMSVTNAISGLTVVGGLALAGTAPGSLLPGTAAQWLAALAVLVSSVNIGGGFLITQRMLDLFKRADDPKEHTWLFYLPAAAMLAGWGAASALGLAPGLVARGVTLMSCVLCIAAIGCLSHQSTARTGTALGVVGVGGGVAASLLSSGFSPAALTQVAGLMAAGSAVGAAIAANIKITELPQMVAAFHSLVGLAAAATSIGCVLQHTGSAAALAHLDTTHKVTSVLGNWIGALTLTGSAIAFSKLHGLMGSAPLSLPGKDQLNLALLAGSVWAGWQFMTTGVPATAETMQYVIAVLAGLLGLHLTASIGGADMPVVVTLLNSYSGYALVAEGLMLQNDLLTVVGALIGSSGAILSWVMCKAMNRSLTNVIFGSMGAPKPIVAGKVELCDVDSHKCHEEIDVATAAEALREAQRVVVVPGYGMAVANAQHAVSSLSTMLKGNGIKVVYGVHPVAGRMPGQLNVLLAEAGVPYDDVYELEEVNEMMDETDVALVIGANDTVNSSAIEDPNSVIAGILCFIAYALDRSDPSNLYLGVVLIVVVFITSTFSFVQEAKSSAIMQGFKNMVPKKCKVLRDGAMAVLEAAELVPGDVVEFQDGDQVPADLRVVAAYNLQVDNSALTGESEAQERGVELEASGLATESVAPVTPSNRGGGEPAGDAVAIAIKSAPSGPRTPAIEASNLLFFSTIVVSGHGRGVVVGTGDNTVMGQIAGLTSDAGASRDATPPLIREIGLFIRYVSIVAILLGLAFLGLGIGLGVQKPVQSIVFCISVIIATVPEGLLCTLTVALALTAKRMHSCNVLVKSLQGVETLGCTTVIASDKTGTLTQNRMTVQNCWYDDELHQVPAAQNAPQLAAMRAAAGQPGPHGWHQFAPDAPSWLQLQLVAAVCNNSDFMVASEGEEGGVMDLAVEMQRADFNLLGLTCTGDASESALIKAVQPLRDIKEMRSKYPKLFEIKFNSTNKWQLSIHQALEGPDQQAPLLLLKGAPEKVMGLCSSLLLKGQEVPLTPDLLDRITRANERLGGLGERVLGFAYRRLHSFPLDHPFTDQPRRNFPIKDLVFVGLMSLMDPPRHGVPEAVAQCKQASIRVFMVTGDHPITARAIAQDIGILDPEKERAGHATVVSGDDLRKVLELPDERAQEAAWDRILHHEQIVFARVTPAHKLLIVENNQRLGQIVAVTGDGVNDAPALKRANIGLSMGIAGKDVSKEAADMILMDDNFASIVKGVEEGRLIFDNLKKSIMYSLTSKPPELLPFILWVAADLPLALGTILILAIDLGTDMLPAIALAYEKKESALMLRPPRSTHKDWLVDVPLLLFTYLHFGVIQAAAAYCAFLILMNDHGYPPWVLVGTGLGFPTHPLLCVDDNNDGKVDHCGFGCGRPANQGATVAALASAYPQLPIAGSYCQNGCFMPRTNSTYDPFVEFVPGSGFRGYGGGVAAVCSRSCDWYRSLDPGTRSSYLAAAADPTHPQRLLLTPQDVAGFDRLCNNTLFPSSALFGFPGRGVAVGGNQAQLGAGYWHQGAFSEVPDVPHQRSVLQAAQAAYFVTVVMLKLVNVVVTKTRRLSIFQHGIMNNRFLLVSMLVMACLAVAIVYVPPFNIVFNTQPLEGAYWAIPVPWMLFMFAYDELRKLAIRRYPEGFVARVTYW